MQDKGLFGSTGMGQVTIKTAKKLSSSKESDGWYPLQPSKSGKATSGALRIRLKLVKKAPALAAVSNLAKKKSSVLHLSQPAADIFGFIDRNDWVGIDEYLEKATPEQVNIQENKTLNSPLHISCLQCKSIDERIIESLLKVRRASLLDLPSFLCFVPDDAPASMKKSRSMLLMLIRIRHYIIYAQSGSCPTFASSRKCSSLALM